MDSLQDQPITIDLLANDIDDDPFVAPTHVEPFQSFCLFCHGTWVINADNTVTYTPTPGHVGTALWDYSLFDADGLRADGGVRVNVLPDDARDDSYDVTEDTALDVAAPGVRGNDPNASVAADNPEVVDAPTHGTVTLRPDGGFRYVPAGNYAGPDSFTYAYRDGTTGQLTDEGTVDLDVAAVNDAPQVELNTFCFAGQQLCLPGEVRDVQEGGTVTVNGMIRDAEFNVGQLTITWGDGQQTTRTYPCAPARDALRLRHHPDLLQHLRGLHRDPVLQLHPQLHRRPAPATRSCSTSRSRPTTASPTPRRPWPA